MALVMGLRGACLRLDDGSVHLIKSINGNPHVIVMEFDAEFHELREKKIYVPSELRGLLDIMVKRYS